MAWYGGLAGPAVGADVVASRADYAGDEERWVAVVNREKKADGWFSNRPEHQVYLPAVPPG